MLELGRHIDSVSFDSMGETILSVINTVNRNNLILVGGVTDAFINITVANNLETFTSVPYKKWRVVALGLLWTSLGAVNEDPAIEFGQTTDKDCFGLMSSVVTGGERFRADDHLKYDPYNILTPEILTEASATMTITWTKGIKFGLWQDKNLNTCAAEAAVGAMTMGAVKPYMVIEVDSGGKW